MTEVIVKLKDTLLGPMMFLPNDHYVGRSLDLLGEFSAGEQDFFKIATRGGAAVDVGANVGAHSLFMAQHFSHVYAFEPQETIFRLLAANLATYSNKTLYQAACGKEEGIVWLPKMDYAVPNNFGGLGRDVLDAESFKDVETVKTQLRMLDKVEALRSEAQIDLLKVDVEGMEKEVLEGAQALIEQHQPVLYVENDRPPKMKELVEFIYNLGYTASWHLTPLYRPNNFANNPTNIFDGHFVSFNLICIPTKQPWLRIVGTLPCTPDNWGVPPGCVL